MRIGKDIITNEKDKKVVKIIHRLVSEECTKLKDFSQRISDLNFQAENFHRMDEVIQDSILVAVEKLMIENGWEDWVKELKEECVFSEAHE